MLRVPVVVALPGLMVPLLINQFPAPRSIAPNPRKMPELALLNPPAFEKVAPEATSTMPL